MNIDFDKGKGLVPAIVQNHSTFQVLMLGYMNKEALEKTLSTKKVCFYSRSRQCLWTKGETSGNFLNLVDIKADCDNDSLLLLVDPQGPTCHLKTESCFGEETTGSFIHKLEKIIEQKSKQEDSSSYTKKLLELGVEKVSQKVGEEAVEVVIEAVAGNQHALKEEASDLVYHLLVLLKSSNIKLEEIESVLKARNKV